MPGCLAGGDPVPALQAYNASILRVVLNPNYTMSALPCVRAAFNAGYKVHVVLQWWNAWTADRVAAFYEQVLPEFAPYLWAVSIGNEQELDQNGAGLTAAQYAASWTRVEPIVAQEAPQAIRVAGEISPWGLSFLEQAMTDGLPGMQAVAAHPYDWAGCFSIDQIESWAQSLGLPIWFTEGLSGPDSWGPDRSLSQMSGAVVADAWMNAG